jgi:Zn-dependent peptidase ImmA (M78 family)
MSALWVHEVAERFWIDAGGVPDGLPRDLREAVSWALPISTEMLPDLSITRVNAWLSDRDMGLRLMIPDRRLRACILVNEGNGVLFVDPTDPPDEQRFSVAHETAHYLVEYDIPRKQARARLGDRIVPVLDGWRAPSREERIGALLGGIALGVRYHLMERTPDGHRLGSDVSAAERDADDLGFELLAPFDAVRATLSARTNRTDVEAMLCQTFGLPAKPAAVYARHLAPEPPEGSLFHRLFSAS